MDAQTELNPTKLNLPKLTDVSIKEVKQLVSPNWACGDLNLIDSREESFADLLERDKNQLDEKVGYATNLDQETQTVRNIVTVIFSSDDFWKHIAHKDHKNGLSREEIIQITRLQPSREIDRVYHILNHNVDPDLIPFVLEEWCIRKFRNFNKMPPKFLEMIRTNSQIRDSLSSLLSDTDFQHITQEGIGDSTKLQGKINGFINQVDSFAGRDDIQVKSFLKNIFFKSQKKDAGTADENNVIKLFQGLICITPDVYFKFFKDKGGRSLDGSVQQVPIVMDLIYEKSLALEKGKYLALLYKNVLSIYQQYFPEIYTDLGEVQLELIDPKSLQSSENKEKPKEGFDEANGSYFNMRVGIKSGSNVQGTRAEDIFDEETFHFGGPKAKRKVVDAISMMHELTHRLYETRVIKGILFDKSYGNLIDAVLNEGTAVMLELIFIDILKHNPSLMNLDSQDIQDLEVCKTARLQTLLKERSYYTEGTYDILHQIYRQGAGGPDQRDYKQGLQQIASFLDQIDNDMTRKTNRDNAEYQILLKERDPEKWKTFLYRHVQ